MSRDGSQDLNLNCPLPVDDHATVQMAHGGGGRSMRQLIEGMFLPAFQSDEQRGQPQHMAHDSAVVEMDGLRLAMTTDSYTVTPLFFPGGDIGKLAVYGTINDLAAAGAKPAWLSAAFILEEGLPMETLRRVVDSMGQAARQTGVQIVTGDTKVVDHGKADGIFINTAGVGPVRPGVEISPARVTPGDAVLVSGDLGRHGIAVMSVRQGLRFEGALDSDCAPLAALVETLLDETLLDAGTEIHCLRDLTRGGLAAALNEIAASASVGIQLHEASIPVAEPVAGACELLGLDPLYVANEGRMVAIVPAGAAQSTLEIMRNHPAAVGPAIIGTVTDEHPGTVALHGPLGGRRILDLLAGEQMPRIC